MKRDIFEYRTVNVQELELPAGARQGSQELGESLLIRQMQPIVLWLRSGVLIVVCGCRRVWSARLVGKKTLEALVTESELTPADIAGMELAEDLHTNFSDPQRLPRLERLWAMGMSGKDSAKVSGLTESMVSRFLAVSKRAAPEVRAAFDAGQVELSVACEIAKNTAEQQIALLAKRLNGATRAELHKSRKKGKRSAGSKQFKVRHPSGVVATFSGANLTLKQTAKVAFELSRQCTKCADEGLELRATQLVLGQRWQRLAEGKVES